MWLKRGVEQPGIQLNAPGYAARLAPYLGTQILHSSATTLPSDY